MGGRGAHDLPPSTLECLMPGCLAEVNDGPRTGLKVLLLPPTPSDSAFAAAHRDIFVGEGPGRGSRSVGSSCSGVGALLGAPLTWLQLCWELSL